jgi:hypothetical protein
MATFVQIEPDAFNKVFASVSQVQRQRDTFDSQLGDQRIGLYHHVRRPVRGIQIKEDTYATLQVRQANGIAIPLFDAASPTNTGKGIRNSNFLLQSITEQRVEKQQIVMTFGAPYIFFFGEQPRMITASGILLDTEDFNWKAEWWENYDLYFRGTPNVRNRTRVYLSWNDIVVEGYVTQASAVEDANNRNLVQFQFQMFLTNYQNISSIGDINAHWQGKDIDLDPSTIDVPGQGGISTTQIVRQVNVENEALAAGRNKSSLFDFLRSGDVAGAATRIVELQGQAVDFLSLAGQFVSGRNIRVPVGFEGAAAFDQEVQLSLASIPGASSIVNGGTEGRVITVKTGGLNLVKEFRVALGSKFGPARVGLPLSANEDEFIARVQHDETGSEKFNALFDGQLATTEDAIDKVRETFELFGIKTDPPSDLTLLFRRIGFGIVSLGVGMNVLDSSKLRSGLNSIGTVL